MYNIAMKRTTVFLGDGDLQAIENIKQRYGVSSTSDAVRLALRTLAGSHIQVTPILERVPDDRS